MSETFKLEILQDTFCDLVFCNILSFLSREFCVPAETYHKRARKCPHYFDNKKYIIPEKYYKYTSCSLEYVASKLFKNNSYNVYNNKIKLDFTVDLEVNSAVTIGDFSYTPAETRKLRTEAVFFKNLNLSYVPTQIFYFNKIKCLVIYSGNIAIFPPEIGNMTNLEIVSMMDCNLSTITPEIGNLSKLRYLNLENNKIHTISPEIRKLTKLEALRLSNNKLSKFPSEICDLVNLKCLLIDNNNTRIIHSDICKLSNLHVLYARKNNLTSIPDDVYNFTNLILCVISYNNIRHISKKYHKLTNLKVFVAGNNPIKNIKHFIQQHNFYTKYPKQKICNIFDQLKNKN